MRQWLITLVMPPKKGASEDQLYMWRMTIGVVVLVLCFTMLAHMAWSAGISPFTEDDGFVQRHEMKELANDIKKSRLTALRSAILSTLRDACGADGGYKELLVDQLKAMEIEWRELHGSQFPTPTCVEIQ